VAVHRKFRRGKKKRHKRRRKSESTTNFTIFDLRHVICKMKIPFLILCLAVVYGACRTYGHEENIDLTAELRNNEDYKLDYANIPVERFLSRHRRASLLTPITSPIKAVLEIFGVGKSMISKTIDFMEFMFGAMTGQKNVCPKQQLSCLQMIPQALLHPMEMTKSIICNIFQAISYGSRVLAGKIFDLSKQFFFQLFLPGLHTTLNVLDKTGLLPPQISAMIKLFNIFYGILKLTGKVPK